MSRVPPNPERRPAPPKEPRTTPRRVRGGVKLAGGEVQGPVLWAAQRWLRVVELAAPGTCMVDGLTYAREGQTKKFNVQPGAIDGLVQGRADRPYVTSITLTRLAEDDWARVIAAMADGAIYAAKLLAGELPASIEDLFGPLNLRLFPAEADELRPACTCPESRAVCDESSGGSPWCKHATCLAYLLAQRLANEPFLMFALRGLDGSELIERLREKRSLAAGASGERVPVYQQHIHGLVELGSAPLEASLAHFWDTGPTLDEIDIPLGRPEVAHPLLRRLGPSPLAGAFPIVGLLASCYDAIGEAAISTPPGTTPDSWSPDRPATDPEPRRLDEAAEG
ncbi:MAG: hypothetical protein HBSAPP03_28710 [Phycisphaerae bacterium]|nr:MAG: hypothetical protein HBSAPP03_28710 [Phycisphaerae bacterium]